MQVCRKCKISIRGDKACCPLCQGPLTGEPENPAFPTLELPKISGVSLFKIALFIFVILEVVMMLLNYFTGFQYHIFNLIMFWAIVGIADLAFAMYLHGNTIKLVTIQAYVIMLICAFIDYGNGRMGWSVIWMIPSTLISLMILTAIIGYAEHLYLNDYVIYMMFDLLMALLQLILVPLGINHLPYMALVCTAVMVIAAAFVVIFRFEDLRNAFTKYLDRG